MEAKFAELVHGADHEAMICYPFQTCDHIILKEGLVYNTLAIRSVQTLLGTVNAS